MLVSLIGKASNNEYTHFFYKNGQILHGGKVSYFLAFSGCKIFPFLHYIILISYLVIFRAWVQVSLFFALIFWPFLGAKSPYKFL